MTESQKLLANYAKNGDESAFDVLVSRFINLVYSTALRLVRGDHHLAEDVAQTVFIHLAKKADSLSGTTMLGGWLHRDTCHVAAAMMRAQRRSEAREMKAFEIDMLENSADPELAQIGAALDEAIDRLGPEDRAALVLSPDISYPD